jgi:plastocyanin
MTTRGMLIAAACAALVGLPALARAQGDPPASGDFQAVDDAGTMTSAWRANGTDATTLTIATGGTVTFHYDTGSPSTNKHNVVWGDDLNNPQQQPAYASCPSTPDRYAPQRAPWSGSCTFSAPGTYAFHCIVHPYMTGTVVVQDVTAQPTATATPIGDPGATPTPTPTVTPDPPQSTLKGAVKLAASQHGSRVRGTVSVKGAKSRLEVAVFAPRSALSGGKSHAAVRVGRYLRKSAPAGKVSFAVPLSARARKAMDRHRRLRVTVAVALTPPGGHKLTRSLHATVRMT